MASMSIKTLFSFSVMAGMIAFSPSTGGFAPAQLATAALLDRYERGERAQVADQLAGIRDISIVANDLKRVGLAWTQAGGPEDLHRRRLVAAAFALEIASSRFWPEEVDPFVEWGCQLVRDNPKHDDAERLWFLTSVAVFGRAREDGRLVTRGGLGASTGQRLPPPARLADHIAHAQQEWPDELRFRLAAAMFVAVPSDSEPARDARWIPSDLLAKNSQEGLRRARAAMAIQMFGALLDIPSLQPEASVRMGYLQLTLNDTLTALDSFRRADTSEEPFVGYLAHFLAGRALDRLGRHDEANAMYRSALLVIPAAQSASEALSANLFLAGARDEAYEITQRALAAQPTTDDPWQQFGYGDLRLIPDLLTRLRQALQ